jgi:dephospho-CoA kinase
MLLIALTGGIGAGKSSAGSLLARLGAVHVNADQLAREILERGEEGYNQVVAEFGDGILSSGSIDRGKLGEIVFADPERKKVLEKITHPLIQRRFKKLLATLPENTVVVYEIPLLAENPDRVEEFDLVLSIETAHEIRQERLLARGLSHEQVAARIKSQASDESRRAIAHCVIANDGNQDALLRSLEEWWTTFVAPKISD